DLAGVVPAVGVDCCRGRLGLLPVARKSAGPANDELAVGRDPDLDTRDRFSNRARDIPVAASEGDDRAHLGHPVALEDLNPHLLPALSKLRRKRGRADADCLQATAELVEHGAEEQPAEWPRQATRDRMESFE